MRKLFILLLTAYSLLQAQGYIGGGGGGGSSVPPANGLIVSASGGQYTTIQSAITAASAGQTVIIYPGTYNEQIDMKDGVNLYFMPGARHTYNITGSTTYAIKFATTGNIYGYGSFIYTGVQTVANYVLPIWLGSVNYAKTYFEADSVTAAFRYDSLRASYCAAILVGANYDTCEAKVRIMHSYFTPKNTNSNLSGISLATMAGDYGKFILNATQITGKVQSEGIIKMGGKTSTFSVTADVIQNIGTGHLLTISAVADSSYDYIRQNRVMVKSRFGQGMLANYGSILYSNIDSLRIENDQGVGYVTYEGVSGTVRICSTFASGKVIYNNSTNGANTYCLKVAGGGYIESTVERLINRDTTLFVVMASKAYGNASAGKILVKNATIKTINPSTGDVNTYGKALGVENNGIIELWNCKILTGSSSSHLVMREWGTTVGGSVLWGAGNAVNRASLTYQSGITDTWGTGSNVLLITDSTFK